MRKARGDCTADAMANDSRGLDAEYVEQRRESAGMRGYGHAFVERRVAASVSQQVEYEDAMTFRDARQHVMPEV